jgi:peptidoglycan/LPS O-acetylase OafA/YrhL
MESVLLLALAIGAMVGAAIFVMRAIQRPQRRKRRHQRAARHAANVRLWNRLFARHDRRLLTDQRNGPERVKP